MSRRQSIDRRRFLINSSWVGAMGGLLSTRAFAQGRGAAQGQGVSLAQGAPAPDVAVRVSSVADTPVRHFVMTQSYDLSAPQGSTGPMQDRKSTRLNSSHVAISYAVFCLKKKKNKELHEGTAAE